MSQAPSSLAIPSEGTSLLKQPDKGVQFRRQKRASERSRKTVLWVVGGVVCIVTAAFGWSMLPKSTGRSQATNPDDFGGLAAELVPQWYDQTVYTIAQDFTSDMLPESTAQPRKVLLKTRDLLDAFAPIYPGPLWQVARNQLAAGYQIVGEFLDLNHANIKYSNKTLRERRNKVLEWKQGWEAFLQSHNHLGEYLASPAYLDRPVRHPKETIFYWKDIPRRHRPIASTPASAAVASLLSFQAKAALYYLQDQVLTFQTIISNHTSEEMQERHTAFHNLRKQLRAICDESELFGRVMLDGDNDDQKQSVLETLVQARSLLGHLNDDWTAWDFYVKHEKLPSEQQRLSAAVDAAFPAFQSWATENLIPALETMTKPTAGA